MGGRLRIGEGTDLHELVCGAVHDAFGLEDVPGKVISPLVAAGQCARADDDGSENDHGEEFVVHGHDFTSLNIEHLFYMISRKIDPPDKSQTDLWRFLPRRAGSHYRFLRAASAVTALCRYHCLLGCIYRILREPRSHLEYDPQADDGKDGNDAFDGKRINFHAGGVHRDRVHQGVPE